MALVNPPEWKMEKRTFVPWTKPTLVVDIATSNFNFVKEFGAVIGQYKNILDMGQEEILVVIVNVGFHCVVLKCDSSMALKVRLWPMTRGASPSTTPRPFFPPQTQAATLLDRCSFQHH